MEDLRSYVFWLKKKPPKQNKTPPYKDLNWWIKK